MATPVTNSTGNNQSAQVQGISRQGRQSSIELGFFMGALGLPARGYDVADETAFAQAYQKAQQARAEYPSLVAEAEARIRGEGA